MRSPKTSRPTYPSAPTCHHCPAVATRLADGKRVCAEHVPPPDSSIARPPAGKPTCAYYGCTFLASELISGRYSCRTHALHHAKVARAVAAGEIAKQKQQAEYERLAIQSKKTAAAKKASEEAHRATEAIVQTHLKRLSTPTMSKAVEAKLDRLVRETDRKAARILREDAARRGVALPSKSVLVNRLTSKIKKPRAEREDWREAESDAMMGEELFDG